MYQLTAHQDAPMLYIQAARDFGRARQLFESVASVGTPMTDLDILVSVTKKNLVASSVLSKDSSRHVEFEFEAHHTFPVVKFVWKFIPCWTKLNIHSLFHTQVSVTGSSGLIMSVEVTIVLS